MRVDSIDIHEFSGSVTAAKSATAEWSERAGMILRVRTPDGLVGQGEASPLPGYSSDAYAPALAALRSMDWKRLPEPDVPESAGELLERLESIAASTRAASARFALETAYLDLVGQRASRPVWQLFTGTDASVSAVPLCSLLGTADDPGIVDAARAAIARGVASVKLKLSGPSSDERVARVRSVRTVIAGAGLRLDANGSLPADCARAELSKFRDLEIEFIEEPVARASRDSLTDLPVPVALDESLQEPEVWDRVAPDLKRLGCVALVLKPMALGGFSACVQWAAKAREHGIQATISHLFDGPVSLTASAHLALAIGSRRYGSGLDPHGALRAWPAAHLPLHSGSTIVAIGRPGLGMPPLAPGDRP